jgi:hypothetical protein
MRPGAIWLNASLWIAENISVDIKSGTGESFIICKAAQKQQNCLDLQVGTVSGTIE